MNILAIDTTAQYYSFSIRLESIIKYDYLETESWKHAELIIEKINQFCPQLDSLDVLAIAKGPGSFTGIRIGLAIAKGFKIANADLKIIAPTNFQIMANIAFEQRQDKKILVIIDAKRDEFVLQEIDSNLFEIGEMINLTREEFTASLKLNNLIVTDSKIIKEKYPRAYLIDNISSKDVLSTSLKMIHHPKSILEPIYFRKPDATPMNTNSRE